MILADTSVWIEYDRATGSAVHRRMRTLIAGGREVAVTEPVIMEVLVRAGITPRGAVDCMIAAVALRTGASLLSHDVDLAGIAQVTGIPLDEASLRLP